MNTLEKAKALIGTYDCPTCPPHYQIAADFADSLNKWTYLRTDDDLPPENESILVTWRGDVQALARSRGSE